MKITSLFYGYCRREKPRQNIFEGPLWVPTGSLLKKKKKKVLGETDFSETEAHAEHRREHCASIRRMTLKF